MDRITESLLNEFSTEYDLSSLPEDRRFEHFAAYVTIRRQFGENFDTDDVIVAGGCDCGIDAIAIIANGSLVTDIDEFKELIEQTNTLDVTFIFVQAERSPSFESAKIGQFQFGVLDFFKDQPALPRNAAVAREAEIMATAYGSSSKFKRGNPACRLFYVTTGRWQSDPQLEARRVAAISDLEATGVFREVEFQCVGADNIQTLYNQTKNALSREFAFPNRAVVPELAGVSEAYVGFLPAKTFLSMITDENGNIIKSIFYDNVRDWQGDRGVNTEIRDTLHSGHKARFVLMNNGVTIIARTIRPTGNRFYIEDFQVVNGCQTSHVLAGAAQELDESVMVPLRLIGTQDEDVITSVIHATNKQTAVATDQFFAVTNFAKKLEMYFQSFSEGKKLFYERRSHQYDNLAIERTRIVFPATVIKAFASMFLQEPHGATRNYTRLTDQLGKNIFADGHKLDPYYVAAFAHYRLEYLFRNGRLDAIYKRTRFQLLLAARLLVQPGPLPRFNSNEMERYCKKVNDILWDTAKSDDLFARAASAVSEVAQDNFTNDNIRVLPFTEKVIEKCRSLTKP